MGVVATVANGDTIYQWMAYLYFIEVTNDNTVVGVSIA